MFFKNFFQENSFRNTIRVQTVWIQIRTNILFSVGPDLGSKCLQRLSADNKSHQRQRFTFILFAYTMYFASQEKNNVDPDQMDDKDLHCFSLKSYIHESSILIGLILQTCNACLIR